MNQMMPQESFWQGFHWRQKRKFFEKKRNKSNELPRRIFYDCFFEAIAVLYYGIFQAIVWMKKEEIR